jgi:hypothetical protein
LSAARCVPPAAHGMCRSDVPITSHGWRCVDDERKTGRWSIHTKRASPPSLGRLRRSASIGAVTPGAQPAARRAARLLARANGQLNQCVPFLASPNRTRTSICTCTMLPAAVQWRGGGQPGRRLQGSRLAVGVAAALALLGLGAAEMAERTRHARPACARSMHTLPPRRAAAAAAAATTQCAPLLTHPCALQHAAAAMLLLTGSAVLATMMQQDGASAAGVDRRLEPRSQNSLVLAPEEHQPRRSPRSAVKRHAAERVRSRVGAQPQLHGRG